jgi:hypothetical protein
MTVSRKVRRAIGELRWYREAHAFVLIRDEAFFISGFAAGACRSGPL